jgi:hypothetical protein
MNVMELPATRWVVLSLLAATCLFATGCATSRGTNEEWDPTVIDVPAAEAVDIQDAADTAPPAAEESKQQEGEVPIAVAETEQPEEKPAEVVVQGSRNRFEAIRDLVAEGQALLRDVELRYVVSGKGRKRTLRGRPVAFALWSDLKQEVLKSYERPL